MASSEARSRQVGAISETSWLMVEEAEPGAVDHDPLTVARWVLTHEDSCPPARVRAAQRVVVSARVPGGARDRPPRGRRAPAH